MSCSTTVLIEDTEMSKNVALIEQKRRTNPNWWETDQVTKRGGVESGTRDKSIQWQGGGFESGTSGLQIQRPNH